MPQLFTNGSRKPIEPSATATANICTATYEEYRAQRLLENVTGEDLQTLTADFKTKVIDSLKSNNPDIEMGEYFVIPVAEIRQMLDSGDNPEFIHVCNALRATVNSQQETKFFPVTILVPVKKTGEAGKENYEVCQTAASFFCEAYPCPPDPRCPKAHELKGIVLPEEQDINLFKALF